MKIGIQIKETTDGLWCARRKNCFGSWRYFCHRFGWVRDYEGPTFSSTKRGLLNMMIRKFPMPKRKTFQLKDSK